VNFLVGESTYLLTRQTTRYRELDKIRVVGKQLPVTIYEPFAVLSNNDEILLSRFIAALALYRENNWSEARSAFESLAKDFPQDKPSKIYWERCEFFEQNPPPTDWDGVFNREEK
jgi:adenylate cyclase